MVEDGGDDVSLLEDGVDDVSPCGVRCRISEPSKLLFQKFVEDVE